AQESPPTSPSWDSRGGKAKMKMSTSSGGLSSGPVGGESGAAVAAVAAGSTAVVDFVEMAAKYEGPFLVVAKVAKYFRIQTGNRVETVSVDRLKPHLGTGPVAPASPPARGRPRKAVQKDEDALQD
ncbi:MAG: hypothetical protein ACK56I_10050, partial [bacterium]